MKQYLLFERGSDFMALVWALSVRDAIMLLNRELKLRQYEPLPLYMELDQTVGNFTLIEIPQKLNDITIF